MLAVAAALALRLGADELAGEQAGAEEHREHTGERGQLSLDGGHVRTASVVSMPEPYHTHGGYW